MNFKHNFPEHFSYILLKSKYTKKNILSSLVDESFFQKDILRISWSGEIYSDTGYSNMNREIVGRLHNFYIIPTLITNKNHNSFVKDYIFDMYSSLNLSEGPLIISNVVSNYQFKFKFKEKIFFTMMETVSLHPLWIEICNKCCDRIWVPSQSNKQIFINNGIKKEINVIPLGIDEKIFFSNKEKVEFDKFISLFGQKIEIGIKNFKFLSVFSWRFHKGYDSLIKSFVNAFTDKDDVCLVIFSKKNEIDAIKELSLFLPRNNKLPQILLYNKIIETNNMPNFYKLFNCYICMSRGEGFGLTPLEAGACGLPIISTFHSGMTEYLNENNSFLIQCKFTEKITENNRSFNDSEFYKNQFMWKVGKEEENQATEYMKNIFKNYSLSIFKIENFKNLVKSKFTWNHTVEKVSNFLKK